jgi:hypothetical protein
MITDVNPLAIAFAFTSIFFFCMCDPGFNLSKRLDDSVWIWIKSNLPNFDQSSGRGKGEKKKMTSLFGKACIHV